MKTVEETGNLAIPVHLQDAHYKEQQNWDTEKIINMHTIIQTTMSDSSIYLMSCPEESFISQVGWDMK